jgi:hypothetical protein
VPAGAARVWDAALAGSVVVCPMMAERTYTLKVSHSPRNLGGQGQLIPCRPATDGRVTAPRGRQFSPPKAGAPGASRQLGIGRPTAPLVVAVAAQCGKSAIGSEPVQSANRYRGRLQAARPHSGQDETCSQGRAGFRKLTRPRRIRRCDAGEGGMVGEVDANSRRAPFRTFGRPDCDRMARRSPDQRFGRAY